MNNNSFVDVVFIIDASGSMDNLRDDVIGGYNSLITALAKEENSNILVTTVVFNDESNLVHNRLPIKEIPKMTYEDYIPSGCTALLDAVGETLDRLEDDYKEKPADKTLIYITTDGHENSSRDYSYKMVNKMIKWHTSKDKWEISFLAANIDVEVEGNRLGIDKRYRRKYDASSEGVYCLYSACAAEIKEKIKK